MGEDQPGGAVDQGEQPAGGDDPPGPGHGTDILQTVYHLQNTRIEVLSVQLETLNLIKKRLQEM